MEDVFFSFLGFARMKTPGRGECFGGWELRGRCFLDADFGLRLGGLRQD